MPKITESEIEAFAIELLEKQGYHYLYAPSIAPDSDIPERERFGYIGVSLISSQYELNLFFSCLDPVGLASLILQKKILKLGPLVKFALFPESAIPEDSKSGNEKPYFA